MNIRIYQNIRILSKFFFFFPSRPHLGQWLPSECVRNYIILKAYTFNSWFYFKLNNYQVMLLCQKCIVSFWFFLYNTLEIRLALTCLSCVDIYICGNFITGFHECVIYRHVYIQIIIVAETIAYINEMTIFHFVQKTTSWNLTKIFTEWWQPLNACGV